MPNQAELLNLGLDSLVITLQQGTSTSPEHVKHATQQLEAWQGQADYHRQLQEVIGATNLPTDSRWLAAIQLKNGIDRFWRKTALNAIKPNEKAEIRSRCIAIGVNEPDSRLALQNALFVAKIVRVDYPHDWPNAISDLLNAVKNSTEQEFPNVRLSRSLLLLLTVVKELSTARLMKTRRSFYMDAPAVVLMIGAMYMSIYEPFRNLVESDAVKDTSLDHQLENLILCLRILRRLLVTAYEVPSHSEDVRFLWGELSVHFEWFIMLTRRRLDRAISDVPIMVEKALMQLAKLHVSMVESHPSSFTSLPNVLRISEAYWELLKDFATDFETGSHTIDPSDGVDKIPFAEKIALRSLLLLRGCFKSLYNPAPTLKYQTDGDRQEKAASRRVLKDQLLSDSLVRQMSDIIVTKFFVFRASDLRKWAHDPEDFERQEESEGDAWKYSVRVCSEKLFLDLMIHHKDLLIQPLIQALHEVAGPGNDQVLLKDSIYGAIGLSAPILVGALDFNSFMVNSLLPELQKNDPSYNILRRRASIMIAQWMSVGGLDTTTVYRIFLFLLGENQVSDDIVVKITAGRQLKNAIDPYENPAAKLAPFAKDFLARLMGLIEQVELMETKIALMNSVEALVQTLESATSSFAEVIITPIPRIWEAAEESYLLKQAIIGLINEVFKSIKGESSRFHSMIIPFISSALDPSNEIRAYLLDDTVDLWSSVLSQAPVSTKEILSLRPYVGPLFDTADENLRRALEITDSYILLAPDEIIRSGAIDVWANLQNLMSPDLRRDARVSVCELAERIIITAHDIGNKDDYLLILRTASEVGFTGEILGGLWKVSIANQNPLPKSSRGVVNGIVETRYWAIFARLLIYDIGSAVELIQHFTGVTRNVNSEEVINGLLTELFMHYDNINDPVTSKLIAMSLARVAGSAQLAEIAGNRLQEFISLWIASIHECTDEGRDTLVWTDMGSSADIISVSPEDERKQRLERQDPVRRESIRDVVASALSELARIHGGNFESLVENVDRDVLQQFHGLELFKHSSQSPGSLGQ